MYVLKLYNSEELTDMKIAGSISALVGWALWNIGYGIESYIYNEDITYIKQNGKEIGIIAKVEVIND